jgi:hypothetical protein
METRRDDLDLAAELRTLRPSPSAAFADELDARAAAGFAKDKRSRKGPFSAIARTIREASPRRLVLPAGAAALTALAIATAVVAIDQSGDTSSPTRQIVKADERAAMHPGAKFSNTPPPEAELSADSRGTASNANSGYQSFGTRLIPAARHREVERDAELVLGSKPGEIGHDTKKVFAAVHAANGIVLSSSIEDRNTEAGNGRAGEANARFELLIPSARLSDMLASLSQIADLRSRHESTLDITAPTVGTTEQLRDMRARIDGVLAQLATAESDGERAAVEAELRNARRIAAVLRSRLDHLHQRAHFAHVSVRIESGRAANDSDSGGWGVDDALDDAGRILTIAAGVAVVGIAVLAPLALLALLAWWANRTWMRHRRERALG